MSFSSVVPISFVFFFFNFIFCSIFLFLLSANGSYQHSPIIFLITTISMHYKIIQHFVPFKRCSKSILGFFSIWFLRRSRNERQSEYRVNDIHFLGTDCLLNNNHNNYVLFIFYCYHLFLLFNSNDIMPFI